MLCTNDYVAMQLAKEYRNDRLREADMRRLLHATGLERPHWTSRQAYRLLYGLGHLLVMLGRRLERYGVPTTVPVAERRRTNGAPVGR